MKIPFTKMHGAKNDFLLTMSEEMPAADPQELAIAICDRHTGVGADGWMLLDRSGGEGFDASIRLFNSDGSEPELSGNGTRCAAALLAIAEPGKTGFRIWTGAGIKQLRLISRGEYEFQKWTSFPNGGLTPHIVTIGLAYHFAGKPRFK